VSGLSSDSDEAKQTQEMHCFAGRGLKCSDPILAEMSQNPLDSEKEFATNPERGCAQDSARSREPLHGFDVAGPQPDY
jgi:hypothetical protein